MSSPENRSSSVEEVQKAYLLRTHSTLNQTNKLYPNELIDRARIYTSLLEAKKKIESEKGILAINSNKDQLIKEVDAMISFVLSRPKSDFAKMVRSDFLGWHNGKADFNDRGAQNQLSRRELLTRYIPTQSGDISAWLDGSEKRQPLTTVKIEDINTVLSALGKSASSKLNQKIAAFHAGEKTINDLEALQSAINKEFWNAPNLKALSDKSEVARALRTLGQTEQAGALMVEYGQERRSNRSFQDISRYITANTPKYQGEAAKQANIRLGQVLDALRGTPEYVTYGAQSEQKKMLDGYIALYSEQKAVEEYIKKYGDKNLPEVYKQYNDMKGLSGILNFSDENAKLTKEIAIMVAATLATLGAGAIISGAAAGARVAAAGAQALNIEKAARGANIASRGVTSVRAGYNTAKAAVLSPIGRGAETFVGQAVVFTGADTILRSTILSSDGQKNPTLESFAQKLALNTAMFGAFAGVGKIAEPLSKRVFGERLIFKNDINLGKGIILTTGDLAAMYALHVVETQNLDLSSEELASMLSMVIVFRGAAPALGYTRDKIQAMREQLSSKVGGVQKADDMITAQVAKAEKSTLAQASKKVANIFRRKVENTKFVPKGLRQTFTDEQYRSYIQAMSQKSDAERLSLASGLLRRELTQDQKDAILRAHNTGKGSVHKWSNDDLKAKLHILEEAKFSPTEIRVLMERGITGRSSIAAQERDAGEMLSSPKRGDIVRVYDKEYRYTANGERWQERGSRGWAHQNYTEGSMLTTRELQEKITNMLPPSSRVKPKQANETTKSGDIIAPVNDTLPAYERYLDITVGGHSLRLVNGKTESIILLQQDGKYSITSLDDLLRKEINPNNHHTIRTQLEHGQKLFGNGERTHTKITADNSKNSDIVSDSNIYNLSESRRYLDDLEKQLLPGAASPDTQVLLGDIRRMRGELNKIPTNGPIPSEVRRAIDQFSKKIQQHQATRQTEPKDVAPKNIPNTQASQLRIEYKSNTTPSQTMKDEMASMENSSIRAIDEEIGTIQSRLQQAQNSHQDLSIRIENVKSQMNTLNRIIKDMEGRYNDLQKRMNSVSEVATPELTRDFHNLSGQIHGKRSELARLQDDVNRGESDQSNLVSRINGYSQELAILNTRKNTIESLENQKKSLEQMRDEFEKRFNDKFTNAQVLQSKSLDNKTPTSQGPSESQLHDLKNLRTQIDGKNQEIQKISKQIEDIASGKIPVYTPLSSASTHSNVPGKTGSQPLIKPEAPVRTTTEGAKAPSEHIPEGTKMPPAEANTPEKLSNWAKAAWIAGGLLLLGGILYMCSGDEDNQTLTPIDPENLATLTPVGATITIDEACQATTPTSTLSMIDWTRKIQDRLMTQGYRQGVSERFQQSAEYRAFAEYLEQNAALISQKIACNDLVSLLTPPTPSNIQTIQSHIGMEAVDGKTGQDGILGPNTIKALQSYLERELTKQ